MSDYKQSLNLPSTAFPMKANLANREPEFLKRWQSDDIYQQLRTKMSGREKFILHDGPPYANGNIHIGHALNKTIKDIIIKSKTLSGFDAPYVPGWDCHGLPIELNVEKKFGKAGGKISADEFRQKCRDYATSQVENQKEQFKRLGVLADWDNPYLTMNFNYEANIVRSLAKMIERGHLQQGFKPVHWCMDCRSALAEAEVEYEDKKSSAIDVRFAVLDDEAFLARLNHTADHAGKAPIHIPIWTTTPWTLPANQAVALNPELDYALVHCDGEQGEEYLLLAEAMIKDVLVRYNIEQYRVVAYGQGKALEGLWLQHPFYAREVPIVLGDHVTTDAGTGAVHTAPGHGQEDYAVGQQYNLPIDNPVGDNGCFLPGTDLFAGEHVLKVNDKIIDTLKAHGKLIHTQALNHSYPHCWRHKTPVIFRATPQWFISMDKNGLRRDALDAIFQVDWIPDWGQARIAGMIENRPDWCISRQRAWGTPITLFVHSETRELHPNTLGFLEIIADKIEQSGIEAWFALDKAELLGDDADSYDKITDTLDVWFDSGVSHSCVLSQRPGLQMPANLYLEGSDQHRGWFQTSLLSTIAMVGTAPFLEVLTHGFTVDAKGHKMSKSRGNIVAPKEVISKYGADVLRLWVASTDYRNEQTISDEILKRAADSYRRIRNTARFLLSNLFDFEPQTHALPTDELLMLDRYIISRAHDLQKELIEAYDNYQFHLIYQKLHHFCSVELGSFYLDIIKDRQYTTQTDSRARRSCQTAMYHLIEALVRWLAPILSFTADEIWQHMPGERDSFVFLSTWYTDLATLSDDNAMNKNYWLTMMSLRDLVNKEIENQRNAGNIKSSLEAEVDLYVNAEMKAALDQLGDELRFVTITSTATVHLLKDKPDAAVATENPDIFLAARASAHGKCERCWHRREDIGQDASHPTLCSRCVVNVAGEGETREFA